MLAATTLTRCGDLQAHRREQVGGPVAARPNSATSAWWSIGNIISSTTSNAGCVSTLRRACNRPAACASSSEVIKSASVP